MGREEKTLKERKRERERERDQKVFVAQMTALVASGQDVDGGGGGGGGGGLVDDVLMG